MVVYLNGHLHLWQKSHNKTYKEIAKCKSPALEKDYEEEKVKSHIVVLIGMILHDRATGTLKKRPMLRRLKSLYVHLKLKEGHQNDRLIALSLETIKKSLSCTLPELKTLHKEYMTKTEPLLNTYTHLATSLQVHGLNEIMLHWQLAHRVDLLSTPTLVVGGKRPKEGMIEMQLFEDLYKNVGIEHAKEKNQLIYEEASHETMGSIHIEHLIKDLGVHAYCKKISGMMGENYPVHKEDVLKEEYSKVCPYLRSLSDAKKDSLLEKYSLFSKKKEEGHHLTHVEQANTY